MGGGSIVSYQKIVTKVKTSLNEHPCLSDVWLSMYLQMDIETSVSRRLD